MTVLPLKRRYIQLAQLFQMAPPLLEDTFLIFKIILLLPGKLLTGFLTGKYIPFDQINDMINRVFDVLTWILNHFLPELRREEVYKPGMPGYNGIWPEYIKPDPERDSRSPCPGLNCLANHGIIPRDGRNITRDVLIKALCNTWNLSMPMAVNGFDSIRTALGRDTWDLGDVCCHNMVEHDASLLREDTFFSPNQGPPAVSLISKLIASATGPASPEKPEGYLTSADLARFTALRWSQSERDNHQFYLSTADKLFMGNNGAVIRDIFGGDVRSCKAILEEERIPDGWVTFMRRRLGMTLVDTYIRGAEILLGVSQI